MSMNELFLNRISVTTGISTGKPQGAAPLAQDHNQGQGTKAGSGVTFREALEAEATQQRQIAFSKHAAQRVAQRGIALTESSLSRLEEGVRLAESKGLDDTLILVDSTAFLVSVKNNKVITTVNHDELKGNVFTNIDGTVIV